MAKKLNVSGPGDLGEFDAALDAAFTKVREDPEYLAEITQPRKGNPITLGPRVMSAADWAEDMVTAATNKADKQVKHSLSPRKDPKERALKAAKKYENEMRAALDEKRWDDGIKGYDEGLRQKTIEEGGAEAYRSGINRKKSKIAARVAKLQPLVAALADTLDKMPVDTADQRAAKMVAARDGMKKVKAQMRK